MNEQAKKALEAEEALSKRNKMMESKLILATSKFLEVETKLSKKQEEMIYQSTLNDNDDSST